jgi:phosphoribosylformylglycinamidine (FGAM) synthase-like enzyme
VLGVIDDVDRRTPIAWGPDGELVYLLGDTRDEFAGSEWAHHVHGHLGGLPPVADLQRERLLGEILVAGSRDGMLTAAHDVSDGGVAQALVEMALRSGVGARVWIPDGIDPFVLLFSESAGRAVVVVARTEELRFTEMCAARQLPAYRIGVVDSGLGPDAGYDAGTQVLQVGDLFTVTLDELAVAHEGTIAALFAS